MALSSSPHQSSFPQSPPSTQYPSVLAWQGSPNHALKAQILAAARERPEAFYPTQRPPSPPAPAVPSKLKPRRSTSNNPSPAACGASHRRPRHNASASSSSSIGSTSSVLSAWGRSSTTSLAGNSTASAGRQGLEKLKGGGATKVSADAQQRAAQGGGADENSWDLAQILSEVDARMARRRSTVAPATASTTHFTSGSTASAFKGKGRGLQRSVSVDRLIVPSSGTRARAGTGGVPFRAGLVDVIEHPKRECADDEDARAGQKSKRLKRCSSSGEARRRDRSPTWEVEDTARQQARPAWERTADVSAPSRPTVAQPAGLARPSAAYAVRTPPRARSSSISPQKRKMPPSPLKHQHKPSDPTPPPPAASQRLSSQAVHPSIAASQSTGARLGMCRSTSVAVSGRVPRFRPPFKPPSQAIPAPPAAAPPVSPSVSEPEAKDADTSFDSFDGMFEALQGSGELEEVLRLVDGR